MMAKLKKEDKLRIEEDSGIDLPPPAFDASLQPKKDAEVGFDCEFLEPPKELQTNCPICLLVLREPYQATCCGYIYCKSCIERIKSSRKPCPTCNRVEFDIFSDKRLHRSLYSFKVWCSLREEGCNWSGELGELEAHLNTKPVFERRFLGCEYAEVDCFLCHTSSFLRRTLKNHESNLCAFRPYTCEFCQEYKGKYIDVIEEHQPECLSRPVSCPNGCGLSLKQCDLENHIENDCKCNHPDPIPCEFEFAGCMEQIPPDRLQEHLESNMQSHLSLMASSYITLRERLIQQQNHLDENDKFIERLLQEKKEMQAQFQKEVQDIRELRSEFDKLKTRQDENRQSIEVLQAYSSIIPLTFVLDDYENRRTQGDMGWSSPLFYTHDQGYRMCLWVDIGGNGPGKGIYMSVFISLTKGEYDSKLKWPFRGSIYVQLLNLRDDESHHTEVIKYHDSTPNASAGRVKEDGRMSKPWGKGKFMRHDDLKIRGFVKNNSLKFRVFKYMAAS